MGIIDKLNSVDTSIVSANNEYMELQLCKEDYEYLKNIESKYFIAYDFQRKYIDDCINLIMGNSTDAEKEVYKNKKHELWKYGDSIIGSMIEYCTIYNILWSCNFVFLCNVIRYFESKYNFITVKRPYTEDYSGDKGKEKVTLKDILEYIKNTHNFIPPSQGVL